MSTNANAATMVDSASAVDFDFPSPGTPGYEDFIKTGKLPSVEDSAPPKETPATPKPEVTETKPEPEEGASATPTEHAETVADPAPAPPQKASKNAETRLKEVLAERKKDRELIRQLTEKLTGAPSVPPTSQTAAPPSAEAKPAAQAESKAKPKPKSTDVDPTTGKPLYKTWEEYEDARDEWNRGELMRLVEDRNTKAQQTQNLAEAEKIVMQTWTKRIQEARTKHADYDDVATAVVNAKDDFGREMFYLPKGSGADQFLMDSELGSEVLYYIGQHMDETKHIFARNQDGSFVLNPVRQIRELSKIESLIAPSAAPKPPASAKPPAKPVTQAPPPPHQVSGKSPAGDPLEKAVKDGDQGEYTRIENERALAKLKSRRR